MKKESSKEIIVRKGEKIYHAIKPELEKKYKSYYYVTIEVNSGRYFVGKTAVEAMDKAEKEFPDEMFLLAQVGSLYGRK